MVKMQTHSPVLPLFIPAFAQPWHRTALERFGKLLSSLFCHQCSLSVETDYEQMLIGFDFQNFCTTSNSLGVFLPAQCWDTTVLLVSSSWAAPPLTMPQTHTECSTASAARRQGCRMWDCESWSQTKEHLLYNWENLSAVWNRFTLSLRAVAKGFHT